MATVDHWQLADGVEEVLPARAEAVDLATPAPASYDSEAAWAEFNRLLEPVAETGT